MPGITARITKSARRWGSVASVVAVLAGGVAVQAPAAQAAASPRILVGAVGDVQGLSSAVGAALPRHSYGKLAGSVPADAFVNMRTSVAWGQLAASKPGSVVHNDIVRWADTLKKRPSRVLLAFHHEPENSTNTGWGTSEDYKAAYRKVVDVFRSRGVTNVDYVLQMTAWAFASPATDRRHISKWYPGDGYVTHVAADPYNWYTCGSGTPQWKSLQQVSEPARQFAVSRGKQLILAEFASQADARRPQWLRDARAWLTANKASIHSIWYFQNTDALHSTCQWPLQAGTDHSRAYAEMVRDTVNFRTTL